MRRRSKRLSATEPTTCDNVSEQWFSKAVKNNFAPIEEQEYWAGKGQRYFENREFWGGPGFPIFAFIGGEGEESCKRLTDHMYIYDLAQEHKALMVDLEHRFYGESYPTETMTTAELALLSSEQALADLARFLTHYAKTNFATGSKIIVVGGSYPGNLSGWFKLKYPHIAFGSIASSAPVTAKTNFLEYMEVVNDSIEYFDTTGRCNARLAEAAGNVADMVHAGQMAQLSTDFKTCLPMESSLDVATFMTVVMGYLQGTVQYNNEGAAYNVTDVCATMDREGSAYDAFLALNDQFMDMYQEDCNDVAWNSTIAYMTATAKDPTNNMRPWVYQTCNEFGYFQTADSKNQPFYAFKEWLGVSYYEKICRASFDGWKSLPDEDEANWMYGNVNIAGTNIIFPNGNIDPWHALGITTETPELPNSSETPVFIDGTAHCADLYAPANSDPKSLTDAREIIANTVAKWLK